MFDDKTPPLLGRRFANNLNGLKGFQEPVMTAF